MSYRNVYIVECVRTPLGRGKVTGSLYGIRPVDLLSFVLAEVTKRANLDPVHVEDVIAGCVKPYGEQGGNIARLALLKAGFPISVPGVQINRACGSAQQSIHFVAQAIASGDMDIGIGCGVEMLSVNPMHGPKAKIYYNRDKLLQDFPYPLVVQHDSAELVALKYNVSRNDCDQFAFDSHRKAGIAQKNGYYDSQIIQVFNPRTNKTVTSDEGIRYPPNMNAIQKLPSLFNKKSTNNGVVSAGTASQITDGAAAVLLASADAVRRYNLKVRAEIIAKVVIGSDPTLMLDGIIEATTKCVEKGKLQLADIDLFEVNEAFATVPIAWLKTLEVDPEKVNVCGGAVAHGHPLGATGGILMTKLVNDLERRKKTYGLQTMCIGWGMATATIIKRCDRVDNATRFKSKL